MEERMKILEMLANGVISASEANELLSTLDNKKVIVKGDNQTKTLKESEYVKTNIGKILRVRINSSEGDKVNVNIPISFIKAAMKAGNGYGIFENSIKINGINNDFVKDNIDIDFIIQCIDSGAVGSIVDIESANGDKVEVYID